MTKRMTKKMTTAGLGLVLIGTSAGCGAKVGSSSNRSGATAPATAVADAHAKVQITARDFSADGSQIAVPTNPTAFACAVEKSPKEFMTTMTLDLFRRGPSDAELKMASDPAFDAAKTVDWALTQQDFMTSGIAYFVSNLLRIQENLKAATAADVALVSDLKQEPVVLVQRNLTSKWADIFTTTDYPCTALTGPLYNIPSDASVVGFSSCQIKTADPQRAGILGMVSVLRAYPSAFYLQNNNYHRNALAVYLAQGLQLAAKTGGPTGDGHPQPLPACVPEIDSRHQTLADGKIGLIFGTVAVPHSGTTCASCHVPYHAEMVGGFLAFGPAGEEIQLSDIDKLTPAETVGIDATTLKDILSNSSKSCWSASGQADPPQEYDGLPGLGRLIANSPKLGRALAIQIQQNLINTNPVEAATQATVNAYKANGETLAAALKGYLLSEVYRCSKPAH